MDSNKSNENTNDVSATTPNGPEGDVLADQPIMKVFRNRIRSNDKKNTVLNNAQITDLLEKDFSIDIDKLHELELNIYLCIFKKFLKEWPQWDEFDPIIKKLQNARDKTELDRYLDAKYYQLKQYLTIMLDIAQPQAKEKVKEVEEIYSKEIEKTVPKEEDFTDVLLEIHCSRQQLNSLFYNKPHPNRNLSLFNANILEPRKVPITDLSYSAVLNWSNISIVIKYDTVHIVRSTEHKSTHTLVNRKLHLKQEVKELNMNFQEESNNSAHNLSCMQFNKRNPINLPGIVKNIRCAVEQHLQQKTFSAIFNTLERDFNKFPPGDSYKYLVSYRRHFFKYPYVRKLYTKVDTHDDNSKKYDIRLRETIAPMYQIQVLKLEPYLTRTQQIIDVTRQGYKGIHLECRSCTLKFTGLNCLEQLKQHVLEMHYDEPDWQCMKCKETIPIAVLSGHRWCHVCK